MRREVFDDLFRKKTGRRGFTRLRFDFWLRKRLRRAAFNLEAKANAMNASSTCGLFGGFIRDSFQCLAHFPATLIIRK